jgi:ubiquinone/menaquinone biosynthesis C-methylase UbiE
VSPRWEVPATVANFRVNDPNFVLMDYARDFQQRKAKSPLRILDIGGGAGRNAVPLAKMGFRVVCTDLSRPMLDAAHDKARAEGVADLVHLVQCPMAPLPFDDESFDLIIAHGIWNLARSGREFRAAVAEAARVARPGAELFLFTFSRHTIPESDMPVAGETFVFTQFNGEPQCFLTEEEIISELASVGFTRDNVKPLTEYNRSTTPRVSAQGPPVLYEGTFTKQ